MSGLGICTLSLSGRLALQAPDGTDLTPKSAKARGVLALLACEKDMARDRIWLQQKLWSTRGAAQAAGSLRQALSEIRRCLGAAHGALLICDRRRIKLDARHLTVRDARGPEFLDGLQIRDPAFERWVEERRLAPMNPARPKGPVDIPRHLVTRPKIQFRCGGFSDPDRALFVTLLVDAIALTVREVLSADVVVGGTADQGLCVTVDLCRQAGADHLLRLSLDDGGTGKRLWSTHRRVSDVGMSPADHPEVAQLSNVLIDVLGDVATRPASLDCPNQLSRMALRHMYSMNELRVAEGDKLLARAYEIDPQPIYLAWRAQLRTIQVVERHGVDGQSTRDAALEYSTRALEDAPHNSMVLAAVANTKLFLFQQVLASHDMAKRSLSINVMNPMGWWALSSSKLYTGDSELSYRMAQLAGNIAGYSPFGFWWDLQKAATALLVGKLDEATRLFERASAERPEMRPPLRYLTALYASAGQAGRAVAAAAQLERLEEGFSIDRLANDRDYPASLIQRDTGLDLDALRELA